MTSIRLHKEHGLNPTIPTCFWCGQDKNEVALLGAAYKGEAPMHMVLDYTPCDECKKRMEGGIVLVEVEPKDSTRPRPEMAPGAYPTGRWLVVTDDWVGRTIKPDSLKEQVLKSRKAFIEKALFDQLLPPSEQPETKDEAG